MDPMIFIQAFKLSDGRAALAPDWREAATPELLARITAQAQAICGEPVVIFTCDEAQAPVSQANPADGLHLVATIAGGAVVEVAIDPDYTPPAPTPDPVQARLEALESAVAANLLVSPHDRRWLAQKERAKLFGIPWLRDHPEAGQQDLEAAVLADLAEAFPAQPLVVSGGVIMSYAAEAAARGYIPDASFASLKGLILASSEQQLQAMLAAL
jgi:hypothetical protein